MAGLSLADWARHAGVIRAPPPRPVSRKELAEHGSEHSCWMAIRNVVYDVTQYLRYHPAGVDEIMRGAGDDATLLFQEYHAWVNVAAMLKPCVIGPLEGPSSVATEASSWIDCAMWTTCTIEIVEKLNEDCYLLRLRGANVPLPQPKTFAPWHLKLRVAHESTKRILERPYTPLGLFARSPDCIELVIREYTPRRLTSWMLTHLTSPISVQAQVKRTSLAPWLGRRQLGLVCNGTGLLPMLQVLDHCIDSAQIDEAWLICCNRCSSSALFPQELENLKSKLKVHVLHILREGPEIPNADCVIGKRFDPDLLSLLRPSALPSTEEAARGGAAVLICGTWAFMREAKSSLFLAGYPATALYKI